MRGIRSLGRRPRIASRRQLKFAAIVGVVALGAVACKPAVSGTNTPTSGSTGFEQSEGYTTGSPNGQNGWVSTGSAGNSCSGQPYDHAIDDVAASGTQPSAYGFDDQSLRMSDAVTSDCFGDQTFSAPTVDESGETAANAPDDGQHSGGARHGFFEASWSFGDAGNPFAVQPGLHVVASPDRGDGARMSWVEMQDCSATAGPPGGECQFGNAGLEVDFSQYNQNNPDPDPNNRFEFTNIATGLDRSAAHTIRLRMWFFQGPNNDVVQVCVDGTQCVVGHSWEDYFRDVEGNPSRPVDSLLFRTGGAADPDNAGDGFFIDKVKLSSLNYTGAAFSVAGPPTIVEGNSGQTIAHYTVNLSEAMPFTSTVHVATANGTATASSGDYASTSDDLTFAPGEVSKGFDVPVIGDTTDEANETFSVNLSNPKSIGLDDGAESFPKYVALDAASKTTTIQDDDSTVSVDDVSQAEGNPPPNTNPMNFTVSLANPSVVQVTVHFQTANGTAVTPQDYLTKSTTVTFAPGQTSKVVNVPIKADTVPETNNETFTVNLSAPTNATIGDGQGIGTIMDDD
jgi:hypothetical protein